MTTEELVTRLNNSQIELLEYSLDPVKFIKDILNLEVKPFHKEWLEYFEKERYFILLAPRGHGKCLLPTSEILMADGSKKTISEVNVGDSVLSYNTDFLIFEESQVIDKVYNGIKDVFKITTKSGKSTFATINHPFLTTSGWKSIEDGLQAGDYIAIYKDGNIYWDRILSIIFYKRTDTWGLEVIPNHNHIVDDFISHNTNMVGAWIIWKIVTNPDIRVLILTVNQNKANEMMELISKHLSDNEKLIEIFGEQRGYKTWSRNQIRVKNQGKYGRVIKEPTVTVLGYDSRMIGGHYDIIILDDVVDPDNSRTQYQREKLLNWFYTVVMPMLEPNGTLIIIGTLWHKSDLYNTLLNTSMFKSRKYKAIIFEPDEEQKKKGLKPQVLWKERFPYEKLIKLRDLFGNARFSSQYQNEIISNEEAVIREEWIKFWTSKPDNLKVYMGVDLSAAKEGEVGDYFVIMIIGVDDYNNIYQLDMLRTKCTAFQKIEYIASYYKKWRPIKIGIEANAMQKEVTDIITKLSDIILPIKPIKSSSSSSKSARVEQLSVLFETGRIFLNPEKSGQLVDELLSYPKGVHDDTIDALSFAIRVSEKDSRVDWSRVVDSIKGYDLRIV